MTRKANRFEDLEIWQESRALSKEIYHRFKKLKNNNDMPLTNQILRSSGSIVDNIAEGFERGGNKEFIQYLWISKASAGECRSQLYRALDHGILDDLDFMDLKNKAEEISKKIYKLVYQLKSSEYTGIKYRSL
jgi:four helix bundle protein